MAGPPTPAVTFMKPLAPPATTAPPVPRRTLARSLSTTADSATMTVRPMMTMRGASGTFRATYAPRGSVARAGTTRSRALRHSGSRHRVTKTTQLTTSPRRFDRTTPSKGPATSTSSGAHTRAKPTPVTRWVRAPATTPSGSSTSSVVMSSLSLRLVLGSETDREVAHVLELLEPHGRTLTAESGLLDPAHGGEGDRRQGVVDADDAGLESLRRAPAPRQVTRPHVGGEPHLGAVGPCDRLVEVAETEDRGRGSEDLLGGDGRLVRNVGEQGGRDEGAPRRQLPLSGQPASSL